MKQIKSLKPKIKGKLVLGIDTSCDETSAAVVYKTSILANVVSSQVELHKEFGGVVPMIAKREHQERIGPVIKMALGRASKYAGYKLTMQDISAIAVTYGPGLAIALEVGIAEAKRLAEENQIPLIAVNHMEGHLWSSIARNAKQKGPIELEDIQFPLLGILISGGHTELILAKNYGNYEIIGETLDDAIGEAYDKVARMLGLGYPGGAVLAKIAEKGDSSVYKFPVPLAKDKSYNFSYSGLKTAVYYQVKEMQKVAPLTRKQIEDLAASFQSAAIQALNNKIIKVLENITVRMVLVGGGVSANKLIRKNIRNICQNFELKAFFPEVNNMNMDNGGMIGIVGYLKLLRKEFSQMSLDRDPRAKITQFS